MVLDMVDEAVMNIKVVRVLPVYSSTVTRDRNPGRQKNSQSAAKRYIQHFVNLEGFLIFRLKWPGKKLEIVIFTISRLSNKHIETSS